MKALRRSIKGEKEKPHIQIAPKSAIAIVPPKKVIRALYDYQAQSSQELSFSRGDFFHVIGRENDPDWYEACNPAQADARGLVPVAFFQALGRTERDSAQSVASRAPSMKNPDHDSGYAETTSSGRGPASTMPATPAAGSSMAGPRTSKSSTSGSSAKAGAMVYGIVMYDFHAERADELEAKAGEAIIVIAQSNPEWFVAKPIGRLGGPGLIPVSFVEIRDMATDKAVDNPQEAVRRAGVPRVEEWKKMAADYKNSSITLGKFETPANGMQQQQQQQQQQLAQQQALEQGMDRLSLQQGNRGPQNGGAYNGYQQPMQSQQQVQPNSYASKSSSQLYAPVSARIPRYCFAEDKYWFVIEAVMEDGRHYELSRYYEDFYDFQIALLTEFPAEAGNTGTQKRTLPYMPGPVNYVTDAITEGRLHNLDAYVKNLLAQPAYISKCSLVKQFFTPREGDYEIDPNAVDNDYRLSGGSQPSSAESPRDGLQRPMAGNGMQPASMNNGQGSAMKVKLCFNDDLIAIRVPTDIQFQQLYEKIRERLKIPPGEQIQLFYKDEATGEKPSLMSNNDLNYALRRNEKLLLFVEQV